MEKPLIELRSAEVDEVLSQPPSWLVLWGITVFFGILILVLGVAWMVQYPDLIKAPLKVVAFNAPKVVNARTEGRLIRLFIGDGESVRAGQKVAYLESTANHDEVLALDTVINKLVKLAELREPDRMYSFPVPPYFQLGELQKPYQVFQEAFVRSRAVSVDGAYLQKGHILQDDLLQLQALHQNLQKQLISYQRDFELAQEDLKMQEQLLKDKVVPKVEYRQMLSKLISKKQTLEQAQNGLHSNLLSQNQKQQELLELRKTITEQKNALTQALNTLKSELEAWKQRYVALAPITGKASFLSQLQEGQTVKAGQELLYVLPTGTACYGEMYVGQYNFGKAKVGQTVIIKFQSHPFQEFGTVDGRIKSIAELPKDTAYLVRVEFPRGLVTSTGQKLPFRNGMTATGEIITQDVNLLERLFHELRRIKN
ncbi:HlyD family efflux transporter periplasmic adaptor subunit [Larkinella sp. GY13]|uniref:HlyD family efflux transporter periplasmic adaptor subunit n=1 Tax=Larkinella sp. GY13 TaxID=3453720 RepID=UPI003EEA23E3